MVLIVTTLSALFKDAAIAGVLVYRGLDDKKLVDAVYSLGVNISVGMFVLQALAGFPISLFFGVPVLWPLTVCTALVFLIGAGAGSHGAVLQRQMKFKELAICDSGAGFARFGGILICAALDGGVWSFAVGEIAMALVDSVLKRSLSGYRFTYRFIPDPYAMREVCGYVSSLIGINLAVYANTNGDNLVIGRLLGAQSLGYYNVAYQLAMLPILALSQINRVNFSVLSQQDKEGKHSYLYQALELYALLSAPIYGVAFVAAPWVIPSLYGSEWIGAVNIFQIVLVYAYARGFMSILGTALNALNYPGTNSAINWALVPLSIPSYLIGAWLGGTTGVAISVALVMGVGATAWFWLATCRAAGWKIGTLTEPVILPTVTMSVTVAAVLAVPLPVHLQVYLQPLAIVVTYGIALSVFSAGRVPQILLGVVKHSLNIGVESVKGK
jgi:O-antigen/teichoic acid export membrane protein